MYRQNTYNEGYFFTLLPLARQPVVPGQSLSIDLDAVMETPAFQENILNGGVAHLYAFYTPYRLLWDGWMEWLSEPDSSLTIPTTSVAWPLIFEQMQAGDVVNVFARRAFKLIYNQYFGSQQYGGGVNYWYDVEADSEVGASKRIRTTDQLFGKFISADEAQDVNWEAPVTGTAPSQVANIPLNEFRRALNTAKSNRRADMTGDKYVDAMRRMGVNVDWRIQMAPEFLGQAVLEFDSKETRASYTAATPVEGAALTGKAYARYSEKFRFKTQRKFFAEHGIVFVVAAIRPHVFKKVSGFPPDSVVTARASFFLGDNQAGISEADPKWFGFAAGGDVQYMNRFQYLLSGHNQVGAFNGTPWITTDDTGATLDELVFPAVSVPQDPGKTTDFAFFTRYRGMGPSPVRKGVL